MAVDTRNKRSSILGLGLASLLVLPLADGTVDQGDRQQVAYSYRGVSAQAQEVADGEIIYVPLEDRTFAVPADDRTFLVPVRPTP